MWNSRYRTYGLGSRTGPRSLARRDGHFLRAQRFPLGCSRRHALDETESFWVGPVGSKTEQVASTLAAAPTVRTVLYPKQGARQVGQPAREELAYHLRGQGPRRLSCVIGSPISVEGLQTTTGASQGSPS